MTREERYNLLCKALEGATTLDWARMKNEVNNLVSEVQGEATFQNVKESIKKHLFVKLDDSF